MTEDQMKALKPGDLVRHKMDAEAVVVTGNYGSYVLAVRQAHITNPQEWDVVSEEDLPRTYDEIPTRPTGTT